MFTIVSTFIFGFLALIWRKDSIINILCKLGMAGMVVWGVYTMLQGNAV